MQILWHLTIVILFVVVYAAISYEKLGKLPMSVDHVILLQSTVVRTYFEGILHEHVDHSMF